MYAKQLEMQRVIHLLKLLRSKSQVAARDHRRAMVENLGELDERHLAMFARRIDNLAAEGLAKAVRAKVFDIKVVARLNILKLAVDGLRGVDITAAVKKAILVGVRDIQGGVAVADMLLESGVNLDVAPLARLLLDKRNAMSLKKLTPPQCPQIRNAKTKEAATSNKERIAVHAIVVEAMYEVDHSIPLDIVGRSFAVFKAHNMKIWELG